MSLTRDPVTAASPSRSEGDTADRFDAEVTQPAARVPPRSGAASAAHVPSVATPSASTCPPSSPDDPLLIAVVLPQFHPIPENDRWWGAGFTEWRSVARARPLFRGHHQPRLPGELGFYDLRLPETRAAQAALAREHGIGGFCYYHYWFSGHRLLERPVEDLRASGEPDFPYCLAWANEPWSRAWNGSEREVLMAQRYSDEDDEAHIRALLPHFRDPRYIRVDGRPLFIVYKADQLPDPARTFARWREIAREEGVGELTLAQFEWSGSGSGVDPREVGLDLSVEFAPDWRRLGGRLHSGWKSRVAMALGLLPRVFRVHNLFDYQRMVEGVLAKPAPGYPFVRCVSPGFDNSARRREGATILVGSTPARYRAWLEAALAWTRTHQPATRQVVFVNAWNEWGEGNHLEPDARDGRAWLEATREAVAAAAAKGRG